MREGKSEHGADTDMHACMQWTKVLHVNAPASQENGKFFWLLPEQYAKTIYRRLSVTAYDNVVTGSFLLYRKHCATLKHVWYYIKYQHDKKVL